MWLSSSLALLFVNAALGVHHAQHVLIISIAQVVDVFERPTGKALGDDDPVEAQIIPFERVVGGELDDLVGAPG